MKRIGVLTSGGDAPGMNACIRAIVRVGLSYGVDVMGIRHGFFGLMNGELDSMDRGSVSNIIHLGGTILQTGRCPEFRTKEGRRQALGVLEQARLDGLILVGGEGTFRGGSALTEESYPHVLGVPATIDNDVYGTDYSIGFDTAVNTALEAIDRIRDTALSLERIFFVEVMGRKSGFIALESGVAGGADELVVPEVPESVDEICERLEASFKRVKRNAIVVMSESNRPGEAFRIARELKERSGIDSRVVILGHVQRGGSPTARDRVLASRLGAAAVDALVRGREGDVVGEVRGEIALTPLRDSWSRKKELNIGLADLLETLSQ